MNWAGTVLGLVRVGSSAVNIVHDCDEVFNYWEPLHYVLHGYGMQTWEYRYALPLVDTNNAEQPVRVLTACRPLQLKVCSAILPLHPSARPASVPSAAAVWRWSWEGGLLLLTTRCVGSDQRWPRVPLGSVRSASPAWHAWDAHCCIIVLFSTRSCLSPLPNHKACAQGAAASKCC